ncbi:DivIVA domain-containing protein [Gordonia hydrophobica]|uniref:DivIVA domain-containing protein n=1 Tax=Gordonia hydrophobica TaxID=40516 RepID=A0ABZ2U215_9ACTN|nr:DivIVA domain-containing protein [Gordonia hydrophobica]MBM7366812.1 DivIVA domain-containing protein [Gordonia hydrophobica]
MVTIGLYVIGVALMVALIFFLVWFVFGRGEELPPIQKGTTLTRLPRAGITGDDVRVVVFQQAFRGYKASEVDWTLEKLAREIDELRAVVHDLQARDELDAAAADTGPMPPLPPQK